MPQNLPEKTSLHYAWIIALAGFLTLFACLGLARFAYGMLLPGMRADLAFGYGRMGMISTGNFVGYLFAVALVPRLLKLFRPRLTISLGLFLLAACMLLIGCSDHFAMFLVLYALVGFGSGLANIPAMVLVSHWFRRRLRGRAAGLMIAGNGSAIIFAGFLIPQLDVLFGSHGWRAGWLCLGGISAVIALLAAGLLRNGPQSMKLEPLGPVDPAVQGLDEGAQKGSSRLLLQLGLLYLIFGATYMIYGTFIVTSMVDEYHLSQTTAGFYWSWVGLLSIFSGIGFGSLSDRLGRKAGLALVFSIQTAAYLLAGSGLGGAALVLSVLLYGLSAFAIPTIMTAAVGDFFGLQRAAVVFSIVTFFFAAGQTVGPGSAGLLADRFGSFQSAYLLSAAFTGLAVILSLMLSTPRTPGQDLSSEE